MKTSNKMLLGLAIAVIILIIYQLFSVKGLLKTEKMKGNGNLQTSEKTVSSYEKIYCAGSAEIRFHTGEAYQAVVTIDDNLEEYVEIFTENNVLNIKTKTGHSFSPTKFMVDVYCPVLTGVTMSGSGSFKSADKIIASTFESKIAGSGKIEGTIECDNYSANIAGSGTIAIHGNSNDANISIAGSGDFNGNELNTKNATVSITGSGNANVCVSDNLTAKISGSGNVNYSGEPKVDSNVSGSGRIRKR